MRFDPAYYDTKIIEFLEGHCRRMQSAIGWTNFTLARIIGFCCIVLFVFFMPELSTHLYGILVIGCFFFVVNEFTVLSLERDYLRNLKRGGVSNNLKRPEMSYIRLFYIGVFAVYLALCRFPWNFSLLMLWFMLVVYLISCDPLPPSESKLKKWLRSFFASNELAPVRSR